jgi:hypothetical protein
MSLPVTTTLLIFSLGAFAGYTATRLLALWFRDRRRAHLRLRARSCRQICLDL